MYRGLGKSKQRVFVRDGTTIPAFSRLGRFLVGKPRSLDVGKYNLKGRNTLRTGQISRNQRIFLTKPLQRPGGGAIKGLAEIYAWGEGASGQLGLGDSNSRKLPVKVGTLSGKGILYTKSVNSVSCGLLHAGVVNSFGEAFTWGSNFFMQAGHEYSGGGFMMALDDKEPIPGSLKPHLPKNFVAKSIACGGWHNLLLGDIHDKRGVKRAIFAWGNGGQGQLGLLEKERYHLSKKNVETVARMPWMYAKFPEELKSLTKSIDSPDSIAMIAAGAVHSVALTKSGIVYWWGENRYVTEPEQLDLLVTEPLKFKSVACGAFHSLGLTEEGKVYSWGAGKVNPEAPLHAQLDPHMVVPVDSAAPPPRYKFSLIDIENVVSIAAADDASLALTKNGELYFWRGTLSKPQQIKFGGAKVVDFAISWTHISAVLENGALYMWRMEDPSIPPDVAYKAYRAQWEDPATRDINYVGTVPLPPFRGGRKGHVPHVGSLATPLNFTHDCCPATVPTRIRGVLGKKSVVGIRLGWNYAIATAVSRRVGPRPERNLVARLTGTIQKAKPKVEKQNKKGKKGSQKEKTHKQEQELIEQESIQRNEKESNFNSEHEPPERERA